MFLGATEAENGAKKHSKCASVSDVREKKRKHIKDGENVVESKKDKKKRKKKEKTEHKDDVDAESKKETKHRKAEQENTVDSTVVPNDKPKKKRKKESNDAETEEKKEKRRKDKSEFDDISAKDVKKHRKDKTKSSPTDTRPPPQDTGISAASDAEVSEYLSKHGITIDPGSSTRSNAPLPETLKPILSFAALLPRIPEPLHGAVGAFKEPTPIQACSWPAILDGRDVIGIAETGSGKTLSFGIPAVTQIVKSGTVASPKKSKSKSKSKSKADDKVLISVLAVAPTRELALQTHETFTELGKPFGLTSVALFGGVDKEPQRRALSAGSAAMIVGTPGRILDLINEDSCDLSGVTYLVLDEADRMLDKGFENDIRTIIGHCATSDQRQTLMFSATWPDAVRRLASTFQRDPVRVTVGSDDLTANRRVEQAVEVFDDQWEKDSRLTSHLKDLKARKATSKSQDEARILIFVLYKKEAARVEQNLRRQGYSVGGIHGDLSQSARIAALEDFKTGKTQLLVATDVAARGLDIPNVGTVINYSFPLTVEDYVHRIGRTGRGGRSGKSITFFTGDNHERALAGELAKVMRESGFDASPLKKFPMTIKKREHSVYGAFYRDDIPTNVVPQRLKF